MLEKEFEYFKKNQATLVKKYKGKVLVIQGTSIVGTYDSYKIAYQESIKDHEEGTFLLQRCEPGSDVYTMVFNAGF